jgi:hypothetical protein
MRAILMTLLSALAVLAAGDEWAKVKDLKTGTEIRIYKKGSSQPLTAQMGDLTEDNLIIVVKKEQSAIPRDQIDRIDARPAGRRVTTETTTTQTNPDARSAEPSPNGADVTGTSTSTNVSFGSKPGFETVYRRAPGVPRTGGPKAGGPKK